MVSPVLLVFLLLASLASCLRLIPLCDPIIDGYEKGTCHRVSVIYDPHFEGDLAHCVCQYIIKATTGWAAGLYLSKFHSCAFAEENDATNAWLKNDCEEKEPSPSVEIRGILPTTKYAFTSTYGEKPVVL